MFSKSLHCIWHSISSVCFFCQFNSAWSTHLASQTGWNQTLLNPVQSFLLFFILCFVLISIYSSASIITWLMLTINLTSFIVSAAITALISLSFFLLPLSSAPPRPSPLSFTISLGLPRCLCSGGFIVLQRQVQVWLCVCVCSLACI